MTNNYGQLNLLTLLAQGEDLDDDNVASLDVTRWKYNEVTGLLTNKLYADGKGPEYTYTDTGRLRTRKWARGVITAYWYDNLGQMTNVVYSDSTPEVTYTYDRIGRLLTAATDDSDIEYIYSELQLDKEIQNGVEITRNYDAHGRSSDYDISQADSASVSATATYGFDPYGRFASVQSDVQGNSDTFTYAYLLGTDLLSGYTATIGASTPLSVRRVYEDNRNLIESTTNKWNTTVISSFDYYNDYLGRRDSRIDMYQSTPRIHLFSYNQFSEVSSHEVYDGDFNGLYVKGGWYDSIGNRDEIYDLNEYIVYTPNTLNQYTSIAGAVTLSPAYDSDGNMTFDGTWTNVWDAENRLVYTSNTVTDVAILNAYDHHSRRISKTVFNSSLVTQQSSFHYDGWNLVVESRDDSVNVTTNYYVWGLDLSGSLQGAGGVGGLLAVTKADGANLNSYYPFCDANGNITEYLNSAGTPVAHYEYDAFGVTFAEPGTMSADFRFRFSSKYLDEDTGLYYYGYRWYEPQLGRWLSRDPIEERGGNNLYEFVHNDGVNSIDYLGLSVDDKHVRDCSERSCGPDVTDTLIGTMLEIGGIGVVDGKSTFMFLLSFEFCYT